jgi:HNH endonuclease.
MIARDQGCCFPGCTAPPQWTEAHHVIEYQDGGPTTVSNGCLLCSYHHREFEHMGWHVAMTDGLPTWTPPTWLDPNQQPVRNRRHEPALD